MRLRNVLVAAGAAAAAALGFRELSARWARSGRLPVGTPDQWPPVPRRATDHED